MHFHHFGPPHLLPIILSSALAFAAGAYLVSRSRWASRSKGSSSGTERASINSAFEVYRTDTISKLEAEAAEFRTYLEGLRRAKDKSEFDMFMTGRGQKTGPDGEQA